MNSSCKFHINGIRKPIGSVKSLCGLLNLDLKTMNEILSNKHKYYKKRIVEKNNKSREVVNITGYLRVALDNIKEVFFTNLSYPEYLQGGIKSRSYIQNAEAHSGQRILISDDISNFYPSISQDLVTETFQYFFQLPNEVAIFMSDLCCYEGALTTGSPVSTYIANILFFDIEPEMVKCFQSKGYTYTRFIDDITVSSKKYITRNEITFIKQKVYGMLRKKGLKPNRYKHQIMTPAVRMEVHGVVVNDKQIRPRASRLKKIELELYNFGKQCSSKTCKIGEVLNLYMKLQGKINNLILSGLPCEKTIEFRKRLIISLRLLDVQSIKKYIRSLRKIKNKQEYNKFMQKIAVLKKVSPEIRKIIFFEQKNYLKCST